MNTRKFVVTYVKAYNEGRTAKWIAEKLNIERKQVYAKANVLRKRGVMLPELDKSTTSENVDDLNQYILTRVK